MDHKDLMNDVINKMTQSQTLPETMEVPENIEENANNSIQIKVSTGEIYLIDPTTFDWTGAMNNIPKMIANADAIRNMMFSLLSIPNDELESDKAKEDINSIISQLETFLTNMQINPSYEKIHPNISDYNKALFMCFDANSVILTMYYNTEMYGMMSMLSIASGINLDNETDDSGEPDEQYKTFKVTAKNTEGGLEILSIEEIDFCPPDEIDMVDEGPNGTLEVCVMTDDAVTARQEALKILHADINGDTEEMIYSEPHDVSGLISD